ncbi:hypothetical protein GOBAR_AA07127 [Gossypium barbadense]|uniref:CCHC-type domain-containing protein n=1 Tax=Gossypium barbadense TaxID=3634 RepID=A0A2P5YCW2_GOSBA|nr:hypothetical protein GOBAR_AA07127 [Gossypium barbadense]
MLSSSVVESANKIREDIPFLDDSNTKKVRFKESDVSSDDVMVVDPLPEPSLSWKDMLVGKETLDLNNTSEDQCSADSFALTKQDVKKYCIDGVPSIDFSERVYQLLEKEMSTSVVLKMLGRNLGITTLQNRLYGIWKPAKPFQLMDIENGYYLAKFETTADYNKILSQGPWVIFGHYLTILIEIGGLIGKVTKLDTNTDSRARGRYARMAVLVNRGRPLVSKIFINGNPQRIEYENLPVVCFNCGCYGHTKESCSMITQRSGENEKGESSGHDSSTNVVAGEEAYGPWMLVERKSKRGNLEGSKKGNNLKGEKNLGSRFQSLADLEEVPSVEEIIKEPQSNLKNKGKAPLNASLIMTPTGRKSVANVSKRVNSGVSVDSSFKGQARALQPTTRSVFQTTSQPSMGQDQQMSKMVLNLSSSTDKDQTDSNGCGGLQQEAQNSNIAATVSAKALSTSDIPSIINDANNRTLNPVNHIVHFNPAFEETSFVNVDVKEGVLDAKNHSAAVFSNRSPTENTTEQLRGRHSTEINLSKKVFKGQYTKGTGSKRGWKLNKTLKGPGSYFKYSENIRVPFADSMKRAAELIASEIDGKSVMDLTEKSGKEVEFPHSVHQ